MLSKTAKGSGMLIESRQVKTLASLTYTPQIDKCGHQIYGNLHFRIKLSYQ